MEFDKLIKNMSDECRDLFEKSVATASSRSHYSIDLEHWLAEAISGETQEINVVLDHFNIKKETLQADSINALEQLKTGNDGFPKIAPDIVRLLFEAWMIASTQYASLAIRPIHILLAITDSPNLYLRALKISSEFEKINADDFREQCDALLQNELPSQQTENSSIAQGATKTPALDQFTINLTALAKEGKIDKVLGRDDEVRQMIDILCRRKQNNPILTGEAGVGKTAVVEGLAERISTGEVPEMLQNVALHSLDLGLLQAGAGVKGEFENRLKNVIKEVKNSPWPIIIFIDEAHTLIGAGNQAGSGDAANLLKPALARGELRTIAATTWAEYKKYFETDAALTRRFQIVKIEEPNEAQAIVMLRSITPSLEKHHHITVLEEAITSAVILSHRYIAGRQLPDKCVSLLDTACARVNLSLNATPATLENYEKQMTNIEFEISRLTQEQLNGYDHIEALAQLESQKKAAELASSKLNQRWQEEKELMASIVNIRLDIEQSQNEETTSATHIKKQQALSNKLKKSRAQLVKLQNDSPMMHECVDAQVVAEVVADWTGIPVGRMQKDEISNVLALKETLEKRVIGQSHGLNIIAQSMQTARAKLSDPKRPLGIFMLVGPSGVGKTETALALAEQLYGSDQNMTVINMSEFKEEHKVSLLMGSPPGYVGYGEGGILTEAVRRKPYSVVLLDEIEKAHPGVQDIFYQVFDKGMLRDGEGRDIDFKNTVIIMTSNTASEQIEQLCIDPETKPSPKGLLDAIGTTLRETYKPAFLGRINIVPYYPLDEKCLESIAKLQLETIKQRAQTQYRVPLSYSNKMADFIVQQCQQSDTGARQISTLLNNTLLPQMAEVILTAMASNEEFDKIEVGISNHKTFDVRLVKLKQKKTASRSKVNAK
ncbi:ClpB-like protein [hydrothermal vent metagenome]|uniref:ClpB-like protein n=1 Tax=hydrothermal vent metagenome TaxID=652676 RepID=A0A3B0W3S4_9ZZZZ